MATKIWAFARKIGYSSTCTTGGVSSKILEHHSKFPERDNLTYRHPNPWPGEIPMLPASLPQ